MAIGDNWSGEPLGQSEIEYILERTFACMQDAKEKVLLAVKQRAKFEGWLKLELASSFREAGVQKVEIEKGYGGGWNRSDVFFARNNIENYVEIKTIPTSWVVRDKGVKVVLAKTISDDYKGVKFNIERLKKLENDQRGFALMVMYPYPIEAGTEKVQLEAKISKGVYDRELLENPHEIRFLSLNENIGIIICSFGPYEGEG